MTAGRCVRVEQAARTHGDVELVALELWWAQESAEVPPDKTRWFAAALSLPDAEFAALLAVAEESRDA